MTPPRDGIALQVVGQRVGDGVTLVCRGQIDDGAVRQLEGLERRVVGLVDEQAEFEDHDRRVVVVLDRVAPGRDAASDRDVDGVDLDADA